MQSTQIDGNETIQSAFVGDAACKDCHSEIYEQYQLTGKGRSFRKPKEDILPFTLPSSLIYDKYTDLYYQVYWKADALWIHEFKLINRDTIHSRWQKADFIIGSGNQTMSFIYEENGYYYEMPVTWYAGKKIWDLSPGYEQGANSRFDRTVGHQCMHCHNSDVHFVPHSENKFLKVGLGISCESCHGPAGAHVAQMKSGQSNHSAIVSIKQLPIQAQIDVCRQCHLEGVTVEKSGKQTMDFRPGMLLSEVADVFIPTGTDKTDFGFASHAERLQMSACYINSANGITCTKCHSPHEKLPGNAFRFYNAACMSCHQESHKNCNLSQKSQSTESKGCIGCHMYKGGTSDIPHVSSTDHYIRKNPKPKPNIKSNNRSKIQLVSFTTDSVAPGILGKAYLEYFEKFDRDERYLQEVKQYLRQMHPEDRIKYHYLAGGMSDFSDLDTAHINNPLTWYYMATLTERTGFEGTSLIKRALKAAPYHLELMYLLATTLSDKNKQQEAKSIYKQLLQNKSTHYKAAGNLGYLLLQEYQYEESEKYLKASLQGNPNYLLARENLVNLYLQTGKKDQALKELDICLSLKPNHKPYLELRDIIAKQ
jgi:tetratricopeptide (TPR) repeat protein